MRRSLRNILVLVLVLACLGLMSGCRASDALKEIIYDQDATIIDYDNEDKFYISNDEAEEENENLPSEQYENTEEVTEQTQNIVVYGSEPNSAQYETKQSVWAAIASFFGIEASGTVSFYLSDDENATEQDIQSDEDEEDEDDEEENAEQVAGGSTLNTDLAGTAASAEAEETTEEETDEGGTDEGDLEVADDAGLDGFVDSDLTGDYVDVPTANSIAAYGDVAVLVQMIGGEGALAAADSELLSGSFSSVFAKHGSANITVAWSDDGETSDNLNVDAVIESGAAALLVPSGDYLTKAQKKALKAAGVEVYRVYAMTNSKYIKKNAKTIGEMLDAAEGIEYAGEAAQRAADYIEFHDNLVATVAESANGDSKTLAGSATYEKKNSTKYSYDSTAKYTLLIDGWDSSAVYSAKIDGWSPTSTGAALSTVGYATTPVSFYIQVGGLVNNAAYSGGSTSGQIICWQFNSNIAAFNKGKWTYAAGGLVDLSLNIGVNTAHAWNMSLFTPEMGSNSGSASADDNFGTENFPTVIAATQEIKELFIASSADEDSIYHPFSLAEGSWIAYCGVYTSGGSAVYGTIGVDGTTQLFEDGVIPDDAVVVNPHGLFSSWTETGSAEAVLECAWVNDVVNEDSEAVGWEDYVVEFYETFYDYSLSSAELAQIAAGLEK